MPSTWDPYFQTPFASRTIAVLLAFVHVAGWVTGDNVQAYYNCPYMIVTQAQVYRFFSSPFVNSSLVGLLFSAMTLIQVCSQIEKGFGSSRLLIFGAMLMAAVNVLFALLVLGGSQLLPGLMMQCSHGAWPFILALMVIQAASSGEETHKLMCLPVNVPTKWYPLALLLLFTLFMGLSFDIWIAVALAHQYGSTSDSFVRCSLTPSDGLTLQLESLIKRSSPTGQLPEGFIDMSSAVGLMIPICGGAVRSDDNSGVSSWTSAAASGAAQLLSHLPSWPANQSGPMASQTDGRGHTLGPPPAQPTAVGTSSKSQQLDSLVGMGFERTMADAALQEASGDTSRAVQLLTS